MGLDGNFGLVTQCLYHHHHVQPYCSTIIEVFATYLAGLCSRPRSSLRLGEQIIIIIKDNIHENNNRQK